MHNTNFFQLNIKLFSKYNLKTTEAVVFMIINDIQRVEKHYNDVIGAKIKQSTIAKKINKSIIQVKRIIKKLVSVGLLTVTREDAYGCNTYICKDLGKENNMYIPYFKGLLEMHEYTDKEKVTYCMLLSKVTHSKKDIAKELMNGTSLEELAFNNIATREIAEFFNCTMQSARNLLKRLISKGLIEKIKNGFKKGVHKIVLKSIYILGAVPSDDVDDTAVSENNNENTVERTTESTPKAENTVVNAVTSYTKAVSDEESNTKSANKSTFMSAIDNAFFKYIRKSNAGLDAEAEREEWLQICQ